MSREAARRKIDKMVENEGLNVREGRNYLDAQFREGTVSFVAPAFGPGTYGSVGNQITEAGLEQPTMSQTAHLVHGAWQNPKEKYSAEIIKNLRSNWLWGFNGLLYVPKEGIYIQDRPEIKYGRVAMDREDIVKRLESNDSDVRFVPFGSFKRESQTSLELAKNPFIIGLAGEEGANMLAQVSDKYEDKPFVWTINQNRVKKPITRVASLNSSRNVGGDRLVVDGNDWSGDSDGFSFGVSR